MPANPTPPAPEVRETDPQFWERQTPRLIAQNIVDLCRRARQDALAMAENPDDAEKYVVDVAEFSIAEKLKHALTVANHRATTAEAHLGNLLARIHRDGGHYQEKHGTEKAVADADAAVVALLTAEAGKAAAEARVAGLEAAYAKQADDWGHQVVSLDGEMAKVEARAEAAEAEAARLREALYVLIKRYESQAKFADRDYATHFREFSQSLRIALTTPPTSQKDESHGE